MSDFWLGVFVTLLSVGVANLIHPSAVFAGPFFAAAIVALVGVGYFIGRRVSK